MKTTLQANRRGLVLMMVMVIMALLATLVMSFLLMVSQTRIPEGGDKGGAVATRTGISANIREAALMRLLRGNTDATLHKSVIGPHSILENLYGQPVAWGGSGFYDFLQIGGATAIAVNFSDFTDGNGVVFIKAAIPAAALFIPADPVRSLSLMGTVITIPDKFPLAYTPSPAESAWLNKFKNRSMRIVSVNVVGVNIEMLIDRPTDMTTLAEIQALAKCNLIINGAPFSGTGIGFDAVPGAKLVLADGDTTPSIYRPNPLAPSTPTTTPLVWPAGGLLASRVAIAQPSGTQNPFQEYLHSLRYGFTSANPDYTAADLNTMFLGQQILVSANSTQWWPSLPWFDTKDWWGGGTRIPSSPDTSAITWIPRVSTGQVVRVIPSFHRPGNITALDWPTLRKQVLRPLPYDNPDFSGGTPELGWDAVKIGAGPLYPDATNCATIFAQQPMTANAAYDVDNDGDGVAESYWMDIGLDVVTLPSDSSGATKKYKPLVAYFVIDLDGRIDINAHGHADFMNTVGAVDQGMALAPLLNSSPVYLPSPGLPTPSTETNFLRYVYDLSQRFYRGHTTPNTANPPSEQVPGRYGFAQQAPPAPPLMPLNSNPNWYSPNPADAAWRKAFASAEPVISANNQIFMLDDFASLLCSRDIDGTRMTPRLRKLLFGDARYPITLRDPSTNKLMEPYLRNSFTPVTADIPSPPMSIGDDISIFDRLWRIVYGSAYASASPGWPDPLNPTGPELAAVVTAAGQNFWIFYNALPADLRAGRKVDLNYVSTINAITPPLPAATYNARVLAEKSRFAQSLFLLMCLVCHDEIQAYVNTHDQVTAGNTKYTYTRLAQWCVNLVDFIDDQAADPTAGPPIPFVEDDIMTPLVVDVTNPWGNTAWLGYTNTLLMSNTLGSGGVLVWGMERPKLIITETLAFAKAGAGTDKKSAFVELLNTDTNYGGAAIDLAAKSGSDYVWRLAIGEELNPTAGTAYSVANMQKWQGEEDRDLQTPFQHPAAATATTPATGIESHVWFGPTSTPIANNFHAVAAGSQPENYIDPITGAPATLNPNEYFVVGPRLITYTPHTDPGAPAPNTFVDPRYIELENLVGEKIGGATNTTPLEVDPASGITTGAALTTPEQVAPSTRLKRPKAMVATSDTEDFNIGDGGGAFTGNQRIPFHKPVFLQRLADRTRKYDAVSNPYITVDWSVFDLTQIVSDDLADDHTNVIASRQMGKYLPGDRERTTPVPGPFEAELVPDENVRPELWSPQSPWQRIFTDGDFTKTSRMSNPNFFARSEHWELKKWDWKTVNHTEAHTATCGGSGTCTAHNHSDGPCIVGGVLGTCKDERHTNDSIYHATFTLGFYNGGLGAPQEVVADDTGSLTSPAALASLGQSPVKPFLPWSHSRFSSSLEALQVPACAPWRFGVEFQPQAGAGYINACGSLGAQGSGTPVFTHRLNFFHARSTVGDSLNLAKFFDYIGFQSSFPGSISLRAAGRVNLNTMNENTYTALGGRWLTPPPPPPPGTNSNHFPARQDPDDPYDPRMQFHPNVLPVIAANRQPFRAAGAFDRVPAGAPLTAPVDASLLRSNQSGSITGQPQFALLANDASNTQSGLESLQRLSELTTTRSNTFAVWVTVGLFEVDGGKDSTGAMVSIASQSDLEDFAGDATNATKYGHLPYLDFVTPANSNFNYFFAVHPDGYFLKDERGSDGQIAKRRYRNLYIIDRTIPVGFRRGEDYNVKETVIYQKELQ